MKRSKRPRCPRCGGTTTRLTPQSQPPREYEVKVLPKGTELLHIRNFTEQDETIGPAGYPSWYFTKPIFFLMAPTKDSTKTEMIAVLMWRREEEMLNLKELFGNRPLTERNQKRINRMAKINVDRLYVDHFLVTQPIYLLFINNETYSLDDYYDYIVKKDSSFKRPATLPGAGPDQLPAAQWLFDHANEHEYEGWIQLPADPDNAFSIPEIMLTRDAGNKMQFLGAQSVRAWMAQ